MCLHKGLQTFARFISLFGRFHCTLRALKLWCHRLTGRFLQMHVNREPRTPWKTPSNLAGGLKHFFEISPLPTWENDPIWRAYFANGLVQPLTSHIFGPCSLNDPPNSWIVTSIYRTIMGFCRASTLKILKTSNKRCIRKPAFTVSSVGCFLVDAQILDLPPTQYQWSFALVPGASRCSGVGVGNDMPQRNAWTHPVTVANEGL